jgi:hypothetical protein
MKWQWCNHFSGICLTYDGFWMVYVNNIWSLLLVLLNSKKNNETTGTHQTMHAKDTS